jgi:hypothetical protein
MSAEKTAGQLKLEALEKDFADITADAAKLGFGGKYSDYREPLARVAIYKKAEADAKITYNGKTSEEIIAEANKLHKKTKGKLILEGKEITPEYDDTTSISEIETKGLDTVISETKSGGTVNLPEMTVEEDILLKDDVKLEGVSAPANEEPRDGETVIEGMLVAENNMNLSGITLTKDALSDKSQTVSDTSVINSRILNLNPAN